MTRTHRPRRHTLLDPPERRGRPPVPTRAAGEVASLGPTPSQRAWIMIRVASLA